MNNFNINNKYNLVDIVILISNKLEVNPNRFIEIVKNKIPNYEENFIESDLLEKIKNLLESDININKFESKLKTQKVINNFKILKERLAELQIFAIIKKLEEAHNYEHIINSFLIVLNNKIEDVNGVLETSITQKGGSKLIDYYSKYLKYKIKNEKIQFILRNE